jgi:serine O-acetyltransferase
MLGLASCFEPDQRNRGSGILTLIISDYLACYQQRRESPRRLAVLFVPRMLVNAELHATALLRIAYGGPRFLLSFWRSVLIALHSIDIMPDVEIGPGLRLPHPHGITFGWAAVIGSDVTIYHNVTIGGLAHPSHLKADMSARRPQPQELPCPRIENEVVIYTASLVVGPITLGRGAIVGAGSWLDHDLEPGAMHRGRA